MQFTPEQAEQANAHNIREYQYRVFSNQNPPAPPTRRQFNLPRRDTEIPAPANLTFAEPLDPNKSTVDFTQMISHAAELPDGSIVQCLGDTGACNYVDYDLVKKIGYHTRMVKLANPVRPSYADGKKGRLVEYCVQLPLRFGKRLTNAWYYVSHTDSRWPVLLGLPWFRAYIPELERALATFFNSQPFQDINKREPYDVSQSEMDTYECHYAAELEQVMEQPKTEKGATNIPPEFQDLAKAFDEHSLPSLKEPLKPYFRINVPDDQLPPPARNIPRSPKQLEEEERWIKEQLANNKIQPSQSKTAMSSFFVNKQCRGCHQLRCSCGKYDYPQRMVMDARPLNAREAQDPYPLPSIAEVLTEVAGHKWLGKFDIIAAFENYGIDPRDRHKTAFVCSAGLFEWLVMTFGFKNAPAHWQRGIDAILARIRKWCRAYMDDGILWADTREEYVARWRELLQIIIDAGLRLKLSKCEFFKHEVSYLGHIVGQNGTRMDPEKVKAIVDWPNNDKNTKRDVKGFAAFASYYRNYIDHLGEALVPLHEVTRLDAPASDAASPATIAAIQRVKDLFVKEVQLAPFDPSNDVEVHIHTDASSMAWGGDISQNGKPLAFISGKFTTDQRKWATTDRELYPLLKIHEKFHYLLQGNTVWITDHKANETARTTMANSPRRWRWGEFLSRFPFKVRYKKGKEMHIDGLTRHSSFPQDNGYEQDSPDPVISTDRFEQPWPIKGNASDVEPKQPGQSPVNHLGGYIEPTNSNVFNIICALDTTKNSLLSLAAQATKNAAATAAGSMTKSTPSHQELSARHVTIRNIQGINAEPATNDWTRTSSAPATTRKQHPYTAILQVTRSFLKHRAPDWMQIGAKIFKHYTSDLTRF